MIEMQLPSALLDLSLIGRNCTQDSLKEPLIYNWILELK